MLDRASVFPPGPLADIVGAHVDSAALLQRLHVQFVGAPLDISTLVQRLPAHTSFLLPPLRAYR